jgi:hypothetical protein
VIAVGGATGSGGSAGTGGSTATPVSGPCDIYGSGNAPCIAAHSTIRALYGAYSGNLYQVRRASDKTTKDVGVLAPGGFANAATQDTFCAGTTCTISLIYDQSPKGNNLKVAPGGEGPIPALKAPDVEANAAAAKLTVGGHPVYAVFVAPGVGYRNNNATGVATGDDPEAIYMVTSGKHVSDGCCFDYGNAAPDNKAGVNGSMEALYVGTISAYSSGDGTGPWVMADLENGVYAGQIRGKNASNLSVPYDYVTAMLKGKPGTWALRGGNAQSGALTTMYSGARPNGYSPMQKKGAIVLGIGGDNSNWGQGTFFEGCMTSGYPSDETENAIQSNIITAGYGR